MRKVLVIIDVQNDFVNGSLGSKEAEAIIANILQKIRDYKTYNSSSIFCTRDTHFEDYLDTREGKMLPIKHCIKNTYGWEINSDVLKELEGTNYVVVDKNIFGSTELIERIKDLIEIMETTDIEIELVGLVTNICVISNALMLRAYFPCARILVDSKCCAGAIGNAGSGLETHKAALLIMKDNDIEVL